MKRKHLLLILVSLLYNIQLFAQNDVIYIKKQSTKFEDFISELEKKHNLKFYYQIEKASEIVIKVEEDSVLLDEALRNNLLRYAVFVTHDHEGNYFLFREFKLQSDVSNLLEKMYSGANEESTETQNGQADNYLRTYDDYIAQTIVIGKNGNGYKNGKKKEKVKISGTISSISDGTPIPQARVQIIELNKNEVSNVDGYYEVELYPGEYTLTASSLGMHERNYRIKVLSSGELPIELNTKTFLLGEAVVSANKSHNVRSTNMGFEKISAAAIKELPVVLGEKDIVKIALLLPGVQTVGEVSAGFNVRGSPADQNMFYINDLPVYNSSHVFGLFTTFNSDAISEFNFYKSNIPIEYGGQLSSIFEIEAKEGNKKHLTGRGGIGPTSARVLVEGPLKKDSSSFIISVRSTYSDWLLNRVENLDIKNSSASFSDALMDFSFGLNKKNDLKILLYGSQDKSDLAFGIKNGYSNLGGAIKWIHYFNRNLTSEFNLINSQYAFDESNYEVSYLAYKHSFKLNHNEAKLKFKYNLNDKHDLQLGLNSKYYQLEYGDLKPLNEQSIIKPINFESEQALINSLFAGDKWDISSRLSLEGGIRFTMYSYLGPKTVFTYEEASPININNIVDTTTYNNNEFIKNYYNFDFRLAGKYEITNSFSVKMSYNMLHQYVFMLSNSISVSPTSKWKLSDTHLKPMSGEQYSFGLYKNLWNDKIETSAEVYYKNVKNLVEYKDGADFIANQFPETNIIQGDLSAYGIEIMLKKKSGKLNGWINYTYSKSEVKVLNETTGEMNNNGLPYPANYDKPHAINLTFNYKLTKRVSISSSVVYSTGRPVTYPTSIYYLNDIQVTGFSGRNEYRIKDYFRTDLSINIEGNLKKNKLAHGSWSVSFYNLTARKNPYAIVFQNEDGKIKGYEISILGTIIPSITYNLKFGNYED